MSDTTHHAPANIQSFLAAARAPGALREAILGHRPDSAKRLVEIAQAHGVNVRVEDLASYDARHASELSDDALEAVSGGIGGDFAWWVRRLLDPCFGNSACA